MALDSRLMTWNNFKEFFVSAQVVRFGLVSSQIIRKTADNKLQNLVLQQMNTYNIARPIVDNVLFAIGRQI